MSYELIQDKRRDEDMPIDKAYLTKDALIGLAFEVRLMRDTPPDVLPLAKALKHIEDELHRIARGDVDDRDIIG